MPSLCDERLRHTRHLRAIIHVSLCHCILVSFRAKRGTPDLSQRMSVSHLAICSHLAENTVLFFFLTHRKQRKRTPSPPAHMWVSHPDRLRETCPGEPRISNEPVFVSSRAKPRACPETLSKGTPDFLPHPSHHTCRTPATRSPFARHLSLYPCVIVSSCHSERSEEPRIFLNACPYHTLRCVRTSRKTRSCFFPHPTGSNENETHRPRRACAGSHPNSNLSCLPCSDTAATPPRADAQYPSAMTQASSPRSTDPCSLSSSPTRSFRGYPSS